MKTINDISKEIFTKGTSLSSEELKNLIQLKLNLQGEQVKSRNDLPIFQLLPQDIQERYPNVSLKEMKKETEKIIRLDKEYCTSILKDIINNKFYQTYRHIASRVFTEHIFSQSLNTIYTNIDIQATNLYLDFIREVNKQRLIDEKILISLEMMSEDRYPHPELVEVLAKERVYFNNY